VCDEDWLSDRVKAMGIEEVRLLPTSTFVVLDSPRSTDYEVLTPTAILDVGGLCLVRVDDGEWFMGVPVDVDGSIVCWASYGDDLETAIRAL
jgi:hypothetical protein